MRACEERDCELVESPFPDAASDEDEESDEAFEPSDALDVLDVLEDLLPLDVFEASVDLLEPEDPVDGISSKPPLRTRSTYPF